MFSQVKDQFEEDFSKPLPIKQDNSKDDEAEQETDQATAEKVTASEDWEHMSVEVAMWNLSLKHLEDIVTLNTLLQFSCKDGEGNKTKTMSSQIVTVREVKIGNKGTSSLVSKILTCLNFKFLQKFGAFEWKKYIYKVQL